MGVSCSCPGPSPCRRPHGPGAARPFLRKLGAVHGIYPGLPVRSPGTRAAPQSSLTEGGQSRPKLRDQGSRTIEQGSAVYLPAYLPTYLTDNRQTDGQTNMLSYQTMAKPLAQLGLRFITQALLTHTMVRSFVHSLVSLHCIPCLSIPSIHSFLRSFTHSRT